ncbi:MAG: alanine--tRNA ligase [Candidatus Nanohaloarchaea archaeon]|nr:alanine--tRNA ligase [Candidatus Nanohaloarchaea archaeon]
MPSLDELKDRIQEEASDNPERFFAVDEIRKEGFFRGSCTNCGITFWAQDPDREVCGEPDCSGGYTFINDPPTEKTFDVVSAWDAFSSFMEERGYEPIDRYPLAARWRNDTDVVRASIYDFQPYVVSGEVDPPANPLVVPQFCFRSNDIDNVGITGRHYTGFIMVGQHAFTAPDDYEQAKYFRDMLAWITEGLGIPKDEVVLHEDSWGGGGNLGACMEFFVRGLELFNQVYMFYEVDDDAENGYRELDTKVLDMGMGHERVVWITHGSETSYEANMQAVVEKLYDRTGVEPDRDIWAEFLPYSGYLNLDEVDDIDATWEQIADEIGVPVDELKDEVLPAAHLYAIADHARTLLVALNDGLLPSNRGEQHSLRVMARRCFEFIDRHGWDVQLDEVVRWHADEFGALYPELQEHVDDVVDIVRHERAKYEAMKQEADQIIDRLGDTVDADRLVELYDSNGITPEMLQRHGVAVDVPSDFYQRVADRHSTDDSEEESEERVSIGDVPATERLYYEDEYMDSFTADVIAVEEDWIVLDRTAFYPTGGGQEHDTGAIDGVDVIDVADQEGVILHRLDPAEGEALPDTGATVTGQVDWSRRQQLMQHHTATHVINGAAQDVLGNHVWQAGAHKTEEKARLDITHYEKLDRETLDEIEDTANRIVAEDRDVQKQFLQRTAAEQEYGFRLYQGGAVPGNEIRVVAIEDWDAEACGGTHVARTGELGEIVVTGSTKVQDGTIRIEYVAGDAAASYREQRDMVEQQIAEYIDTERPLLDIAEIFDVEVEQLPRVVERFVEEWEDREQELERLKERVGDGPSYGERPRDPEELFEQWKQLEKDIETVQAELEQQIREELQEGDGLLRERIETEDVGMLIRIARHLVDEDEETAVLLVGKKAAVAAVGAENEADARELVGEVAAEIQGDAAFAKGFALEE